MWCVLLKTAVSFNSRVTLASLVLEQRWHDMYCASRSAGVVVARLLFGVVNL
jgi:hypothetical protein